MSIVTNGRENSLFAFLCGQIRIRYLVPYIGYITLYTWACIVHKCKENRKDFAISLDSGDHEKEISCHVIVNDP